ncbi:hypothetical protein NKR23_g12336 [Pleurostoma richardsiae]|uniref:AB hydrolase-1 domain-containing protein n=1 Tax=Pleurostoma richardsiae TaxID=41990 RepID=A0AA38VG48_9PEZI|nr:hypothetical protein NKR23_g12336 [Pleurostoma richardsiae]
MLGGRYLAALVDCLGKKHGLRIVAVDRPGKGGSTNVKANQRIKVWLETVPVLMRQLKTDHVSIVAHCCGVIYALNTVYAMPQILLPSKPVLYLFAPWVHPCHSGVEVLSVASKMPTPVISYSIDAVSFLNRVIARALNFSSIAISSTTSSFTSFSGGDSERSAADQPNLGLSAQESTARLYEITHRMLKEDMSGASGEALLSLHKAEAGPWGACDKYETCPRKLEERMRNCHATSERGECPRLLISVFWAEKDMTIGKGGEIFFDKCFKAFSAESDRCLEYRSEIVPETDHESVCLPCGAFPKICEEIAAKS